jgi:hypothetical protein
MSAITGFGPFDTRASLPATPPAGAAAARPASAWFEGAQRLAHPPRCVPRWNPALQGLGVQQHAERVLAHLLAEPTALA